MGLLPGSRIRRASPEATFVRLALQGAKPSFDPGIEAAAKAVANWHRVAEISVQHRLSAWILQVQALSGRGSLLDRSCAEQLRFDARLSSLRSLALDGLLADLLPSLQAIDETVMVLKGPTIAGRFYPDPSLRPYHDLDLLVAVSAWAQVDAEIKKRGYQVWDDRGGVGSIVLGTSESPFEVTYVHPVDGLTIDIHYDHLQVGLKPRTLEGFWDRGQTVKLGSIEVRTPGLTDHCLLLLVHLQKHGFERLIWFKDLDLILRAQAEEVDWVWLARAARAEGLLASVRYGLHLLECLFSTPLPTSALSGRGSAPGGLFQRLIWREHDILNLDTKPLNRRRMVQYVPRDGVRGLFPSFLIMGRRKEKAHALWRRYFKSNRGSERPKV